MHELCHLRYRGHYLHEESVVFAYTVNGTEILDSIERLDASFVRTIHIAAHDKPLSWRVSVGFHCSQFAGASRC